MKTQEQIKTELAEVNHKIAGFELRTYSMGGRTNLIKNIALSKLVIKREVLLWVLE